MRSLGHGEGVGRSVETDVAGRDDVEERVGDESEEVRECGRSAGRRTGRERGIAIRAEEGEEGEREGQNGEGEVVRADRGTAGPGGDDASNVEARGEGGGGGDTGFDGDELSPIGMCSSRIASPSFSRSARPSVCTTRHPPFRLPLVVLMPHRPVLDGRRGRPNISTNITIGIESEAVSERFTFLADVALTHTHSRTHSLTHGLSLFFTVLCSLCCYDSLSAPVCRVCLCCGEGYYLGARNLRDFVSETRSRFVLRDMERWYRTMCRSGVSPRG